MEISLGDREFNPLIADAFGNRLILFPFLSFELNIWRIQTDSHYLLVWFRIFVEVTEPNDRDAVIDKVGWQCVLELTNSSQTCLIKVLILAFILFYQIRPEAEARTGFNYILSLYYTDAFRSSYILFLTSLRAISWCRNSFCGINFKCLTDYCEQIAYIFYGYLVFLEFCWVNTWILVVCQTATACCKTVHCWNTWYLRCI